MLFRHQRPALSDELQTVQRRIRQVQSAGMSSNLLAQAPSSQAVAHWTRGRRANHPLRVGLVGASFCAIALGLSVFLALPGMNESGTTSTERTPSAIGPLTFYDQSAAAVELSMPEVDSTTTEIGDEAVGGVLGVVAEAKFMPMARISSPPGFDGARLRGGPGQDATGVAFLKDGTPLQLLDGRAARDGYTWVQVRLEDATQGWIVEGTIR